MLKNILFVMTAFCAFNASASTVTENVAKAMSAAMERNLTVEEIQSINTMVSELTEQASAPIEMASVETMDMRTVGYNMGCLTIKGGAVLAATQKLVCTNLMEVITISKAVGMSDAGTFNLSANAGVVYARMFVTSDAYSRLQGLELLAEPVDAIGVDGAYLYGAQVVFFSSPNVSLSLWGLTVGGGGGVVFEQNGAVDRELWDGTTLNIKKFNF
jgi:hypothetical protein